MAYDTYHFVSGNVEGHLSDLNGLQHIRTESRTEEKALSLSLMYKNLFYLR